MDDDSERYAAMIAEDRELSAQEGREPAVPEMPGPVGRDAEPYDSQQHGTPEAPQHHEQPELQPHDAGELPNVLDDPVAHFSARMQNLEGATVGAIHQSQHDAFWNHVARSEDLARAELGPEYDAATDYLANHRIAELAKQFPDGNREAELLAHSYGLPSAAHLRGALFERDRVMVAQHAAQNGLSPADSYFQLAVQRGYQPKIAMTRTQRRQLANTIANADGEDFDKAWDNYAKAAQFEDEAARR